MAERGGLVVVEAEAHAERHLGERGRKRHVGRRGEDGVAAQDEEQLDPASLHVLHERAQRRELILRPRLDRRGVDDRLPHVAERLVHGVRERVHGGRLVLAGDDGAPAAVAREVPHERFDEGQGRRLGPGHAGPQARGDRARGALHVARGERQAMVGLRARRGERALEHVEAVHLGRAGAPAGGEVAHVAQVGRAAAQEVGVEGQDHLGVGEAVVGVDVVAEGEPRPGARRVAADRLPLVPARLGELAQERAELAREGGRGDGLGQDAEPGAPARALRPERRAEHRQEAAPRADVAQVGEGLRAVGVVERQHRGLCRGVGRTQAGRMLGVALDLGRPPHVALDQHAGADPARVGHGGGEEERLSRDDVLGRLHVGDDLLGRLAGARREPAERERGRHQLQELAAAERVQPGGGLRGVLAREEGLERGRVQLLEAPPPRAAGLAHR